MVPIAPSINLLSTNKNEAIKELVTQIIRASTSIKSLSHEFYS